MMTAASPIASLTALPNNPQDRRGRFKKASNKVMMRNRLQELRKDIENDEKVQEEVKEETKEIAYVKKESEITKEELEQKAKEEEATEDKKTSKSEGGCTIM